MLSKAGQVQQFVAQMGMRTFLWASYAASPGGKAPAQGPVSACVALR